MDFCTLSFVPLYYGVNFPNCNRPGAFARDSKRRETCDASVRR